MVVYQFVLSCILFVSLLYRLDNDGWKVFCQSLFKLFSDSISDDKVDNHWNVLFCNTIFGFHSKCRVPILVNQSKLVILLMLALFRYTVSNFIFLELEIVTVWLLSQSV